MLWQPSLPEKYLAMSDADLARAIAARRKELGDDLLILGHHYQQDDVIQHADLTGDSLKLSQMAAKEARQRGTKFIVFCGVHFMAETAEIVTNDEVRVILPDLSAGCSMADMAEYDDVEAAWREIHESLARSSPSARVIPITYVNSSAAVKAFVGAHGGACCTSSNARRVFDWALAGGVSDARGVEATPGAMRRGAREPRIDAERRSTHEHDIRIIFLPDQHLGRNTASAFGLLTEVDEAEGRGAARTRVWNPRKDRGGLTDEQIGEAKVLLWAGHCSVHKLFRPEHVDQVRAEYAAKGDITVLVHPECCKEVVDKADLNGSTEYIIRQIEQASPGTNWAVGTEVHLVNRLSREAAKRGVHVRILSDCQCLCTTMYRIDQPHLLWALDHLAEGRVVNEVKVHAEAMRQARLALDRMLSLVGEAGANRAAPVLVD
jgi:quinolinate synthase